MGSRLFPGHSRPRMVVSGLFVLVMLYASLVEPNWLWVTRLGFQGPSGGGGPVLRVAQVSDLHLRSLGWRERQVIKALTELQPHLVVLTGDMVVTEHSLPLLEEFLQALPRSSRVLATQGNWEHYINATTAQLRQLYQRHGAVLLNNESITLEVAGRSVLVTGVDDAFGGEADLGKALKKVKPADNHLILIHSPEYFDLVAPLLLPLNNAKGQGEKFRPTLVLAGHTHGGQVTFFGQAINLPPGSGSYVAGWYGTGFPRLYVSRGIGLSIAPLRFFSPPELPVFDWELY